MQLSSDYDTLGAHRATSVISAMADKAPCSESGRDTRKRTNPGGRHPKINQRRARISLSDKHKAHKQQKAPFILLCLQSSWLHVNIFVEAVMWVQTHTSMLVGQRVWGRQIGRVKDHSWREPAVPLVCLEIRPWTLLKKKKKKYSHFSLSFLFLSVSLCPCLLSTAKCLGDRRRKEQLLYSV